MTDTLKIVKIQISNVLGIDEIGIEPGKITVLQGGNATCKTSALEAIKIALGGGSLVKLANIHAPEGEEPEVVLVLQSDDDEYRIEKTGSKTARVRQRVGDTAAFEDTPEPARFLKGLYDGKMANPVQLLTASDKDRITLILGALPLELDRERLWKDMGISPSEIGAVPSTLHPLQEIAWIRDLIFDKRTGVNRDQKGKAQSAEQLRRNIPAVLPDGHAKEIVALENDIGNRASAVDVETEKAKNECNSVNSANHSESEAIIKKLGTDYEQRSITARKALDAKLAAEKEGMLGNVSRTKEAANLFEKNNEIDRDKKIAAHNETRAAIETDRVRLAEMRTEAEAATKARALHEQAEEFDGEAKQLEGKGKQLTAAIDALDAYRRGLASDLPIEGLEVDDKEIRVNGVQWAQLNTAQRIDIAVKIACLRAEGQPLPLVFLDGAEALDPENFETLKKRLAEKTPQAFIGRVDSGKLTIND